MDLAQVGGDVSLGQLIIFCYSQALVITDKLSVSLRHSFNRVLVRTANIISATKNPRETNILIKTAVMVIWDTKYSAGGPSTLIVF